MGIASCTYVRRLVTHGWSATARPGCTCLCSSIRRRIKVRCARTCMSVFMSLFYFNKKESEIQFDRRVLG